MTLDEHTVDWKCLHILPHDQIRPDVCSRRLHRQIHIASSDRYNCHILPCHLVFCDMKGYLRMYKQYNLHRVHQIECIV